MSRRVRLALFAVSAAGLGALLLYGLAGLPDFGHYRGPYGLVLNRVAVEQRHAANVVSAVVFDYRGLDTLGEEFLLFAAAVGVALLLREARDDELGRPEDAVRGEAIRATGLGIVGLTVVLGLYLVAHGYLTPGGGFQGGVVLAAAVALVYLAGSYRAFRRVSPAPLIDLAKGVGAGGFVLVGVAALASGGAFLENVLPLGRTGTLASAGTIPLLNAATALEVAAAFTLLFTEFVEELEQARHEGRGR